MAKIKVNCLYCTNEFLAFPSDIKRGNSKYCKNECRLLHKKGEIISLACCECGVEFERYKCQLKNSKLIYCSSLCQSKRLLEMECKQCGKKFKKHLSDKKRGAAKFCSFLCYKLSLQKNPIEYFFLNISKESHELGCWDWVGRKDKNGYGILSIGGNIRAHRFSYELYYEKIKTGMLICHKCDRPACVNPHHLFQGTPLDNTKDMWNKGRSFWQNNY